MSRRTPETLVDWLVVGIAPFLIMLLVGSLVFYLAEVFYLGDYPLRLLWVLGLFVMAIVCVARISMEDGAAYASLYALPLAGAVGLALATFVKVGGPLAALGPLVNWSLMALVWWAAHKLTWDCTLIEGGRDFTGQGLMQTTGLDRFFTIRSTTSTKPEDTPPPVPQPDLAGTSSTAPAATLPVWQWWLSKEQRPHAPGVWVVYFSLAALPLFGLGQWFMPTDGLELRRRAFWLLVIYVAAGLSLLMATSFLSLRRYLRQRNLEMPNEMAAVWLGTGGAMIFVLLILASLLPRPIPEYSITHLAPDIKSPERSASRWGWGKEGAKSKPDAAHTATKGEPAKNSQQSGSQGTPQPGSGSKNGKSGSPSGSQGQGGQSNSSDKAQQNNSSSGKSKSDQAGKNSSDKSDSNPSPNDPPNQSKSGNEPANSKSDNKSNPPPTEPQPQQSKSDTNSQAQPQSQPNQTANTSETRPLPQEVPATPPSPQTISNAIGQFFAFLMHGLKWIFYLLVAAIIGYYVWKNREQLLTAWQQLLKELRDLWQKWFGQPQSAQAVHEPVVTPLPQKKFADFADPFSAGLAARWSLAELVQYTFAALEARGRERNCPRGVEQTPLEYAAAVGQVEPAFASEFRSLADLYGQLAFARGTASPQSTTLLQQLWQRWK